MAGMSARLAPSTGGQLLTAAISPGAKPCELSSSARASSLKKEDGGRAKDGTWIVPFSSTRGDSADAVRSGIEPTALHTRQKKLTRRKTRTTETLRFITEPWGGTLRWPITA